MKIWTKVASGCLFMSFFVISFISRADALPVFARKYKTSCSTCHIAPPLLNSFGLSFRLNGYRFPQGDEDLVKDEPVEMGVEEHKEMGGHVWPSTIPGLPPISLRFFGDATYTPADKRAVNFDFPTFWRLLSGGTLDENISFLMTICFKSNDKTSTVIPFQAQILYSDIMDNVLGKDSLNLRFGLIDLRNLGWINFFQHLTISNYLYGSTKLPVPATVTQRNDFIFLGPGGTPGFELNGLLLKKRLYWAATINNGDDFGTNDDNTGKDKQFLARYKFGGIPYGHAPGSGGTRSPFREKNSIQFGGLYYEGNAEVGTTSSHSSDQFRRYGADLQIQHNMENSTKSGSWRFMAAIVTGPNDDPYGQFSADGAYFDSHYLEFIFAINQWLIPAVRYESVKWTLPADGGVPNLEQKRFVPHITYRVRHNFKISIEGNLYTKNTMFASASDANTYLMRYDLAF